MTDHQITAAITAVEAAFPTMPISYYHAHLGTTIPCDHTVIIVFPRLLDWERRSAVEALVRAIRVGLQLEIAIEVTDQVALQFIPHPVLSHAAACLHGPDIREQIAPITFKQWYADHLHHTYRQLIVPSRPVTPLRLPLEYPDPKAAWFGYIHTDDLHPLIQVVRACAIAQIATQQNAILVGPIDLIGRYREVIGGKMADWLRQVILNAQSWRYRVPQSQGAALRELSRDVLLLENEFMQLYRRMVLAHLWGADQDRRDQALQVMQQHPLDDPDIRGAIHAQR